MLIKVTASAVFKMQYVAGHTTRETFLLNGSVSLPTLTSLKRQRIAVSGGVWRHTQIIH